MHTVETWTPIAISALALGVAIWALVYACDSAASARSSATAASTVAGIETERRHDEISPQFRIAASHDTTSETVTLTITLTGHANLHHLNTLKAEIYGAPRTRLYPYQFSPNTQPRPSANGQVVQVDGQRTIGESWTFQLVPTSPPPGSEITQRQWQARFDGMIRLRLECQRDGDKPWTMPCEIKLVEGQTVETTVPGES